MRLFRLFCLGDVPTSAPKTMICNCNTSPSGRTGHGLLDRGATPKSSAANAVQPPCLPAVDLRAGTPIRGCVRTEGGKVNFPKLSHTL